MQNRYVGDVGDFGKYGLLKAVCAGDSSGELTLGVVWYLFPDEDHNADGKHISYLLDSHKDSQAFKACDPTLYDSLKELVFKDGMVPRDSRNVEDIRDHHVLPAGTVFYEHPLSFVRPLDTKLIPLDERVALRDAWQRDALEQTSSCDVVFVDPDNGLEVKVKPHQKRGPKYVFFSDLIPYVGREQSLVIYHHIGRRGSALEQVKERFAQIKGRLNRDSFALLYHRGTARAYFIVPSQKHQEILFDRSSEFVRGPWERHFELVPPLS